MRRREFIGLLVSAAIASPVPARAQHAGRARLVGVATGFSDTEMQRPLKAFREKLKELGWTEVICPL
jgi:hypothetical protein